MRILLVLGAVSFAEGQDAPGKRPAEGSYSVLNARERWTQDRLHATLERLRKSVRKLDNDLYAVRQEASREIVESINELIDEVNPPPPEVMEVFGNLHAKAKAGQLSPEQRMRLTYVGEDIRTSMAEKPDRIPPLQYEWKECLLAIGEQTGFRVDVTGVAPEILTATIEVRSGQNGCFELLRKFCQTADVTPEFSAERDVIRLVQRKGTDRTRIGGKGKVLAIANENEEGRVSVDVRMSPRAGRLVAIKNVVSGDKGTSAVNIGDPGVPVWKFTDVGSPPSHSGQATFNAAMPWVSAECSVVEQAETIRLTKDGDGGRIGFQSFRVLGPDDGMPTQIQVNAWVFADVPWPSTPCDVDSKTYGAGAASMFQPRDAAGKLIPGRIIACEVNQRLMKFTIECEGVPASVDITAYREFTLEKDIRVEIP